MAIDQVVNSPWMRKHDEPGSPTVPVAPKILYPKSLEELISICADRQPEDRFKAAGSHWALSSAAVSNHTFIKTHDPNNQFPAMGRTIYDVVPRCLTQEFVMSLAEQHPKPYDDKTVSEDEGVYLVHVETGKRIYQLYSELDWGDNDSRSLARLLKDKHQNQDYAGAWAFRGESMIGTVFCLKAVMVAQ